MTMDLDSRLAQETVGRWVGNKAEDANTWTLNMGYAISGMTRKLNFQKFGPRGAIFPSVRKQDDGSVLLAIKWVTAKRGFRRIVERNLKVAKRHIWTTWTADPKW